MYTQVIENRKPGEPFIVVHDGTHPGETIQETFSEESSAWNRRDELLDNGITGVRFVNAPTIIAGSDDVGHLPLIDIRDEE